MIQSLDLFSALASSTVHRQLTPGQMLFRRGDAAFAVFAVEVGRVKLVRYMSNGSEVCLHMARAKENFAEAALFSDVYHCDAVAELPSRIAVYPKQAVLQLLQEHPRLSLDFTTLLAKQIQSLRTQLELHNVRSACDRVLQYLSLLVEPEQPEVTFDGIEVLITGTGRTKESIQRLVPAHAQELNQMEDYQATTAFLPDGMRLTVTSENSQQAARIRALGFIGLLVSGGHHQAHHLALARGIEVH